jgi:hypothetical protein
MVGVINLSHFLLATVTILSWHLTYQSSAKSVFSGSGQIRLHRDNFIVRRDWQKMRHGGLSAGTNPA